MATHTRIAVLESRWWTTSNTSVRGLFDLIADISFDNPHAYEYEMANSEAAAKETIPRLGKSRRCKYLCLAMHGNTNGLILHNGERISRAELRNMLEDIHDTPNTRLHGLHLSSCIFGTKTLADFMFRHRVGVFWISGYREKVDFLNSSAMDLLFFNELVGGAVGGESPIQAIKRTADKLKKVAAGLAAELGFEIYVRKPKTGGAKALVAAGP